jgi:hypothetical protein
MMGSKRSWWILLLGMLVAALTLACSCMVDFREQAKRQILELKVSLGTQDDPFHFKADSIRPGMSRERVWKIIRGYTETTTEPGSDGVTYESYRYRFGGESTTDRLLRSPNDAYVIVIYDANWQAIHAWAGGNFVQRRPPRNSRSRNPAEK